MAVETGAVGNHVAATKERSIYCAGRPSKRHEDLPAEFALPDGQQRWTWLRLTAQLAECFGWSKYYHAPEAAAACLEACPVDQAAASLVAQEGTSGWQLLM